MTARLILGDCIASMRELEPGSVDAVVTDPPYGINFMGKAWDGKAIEEAAAQPRDFTGLTRLTGSKEDADRKAIPRSASGFANRAGEAGAYDFSVGRFGDERDWSQMGGPIGKDHTKQRERSGAMHAGEDDLTPRGNRGFQAWCELWALEAFRVLKPGGHMLVFGGTRTYHRMAAGIEDAGFEIRDCIAWMYGSGFPKSLDVGKAIDKAMGHWRGRAGAAVENDSLRAFGQHYERTDKGDPVTAAAAAWDGWGTALKPAFEPIVVARKPLVGTVARNVLAHGTGALNVDGCRIETLGRWPANVILDEDAAELLDEQSGPSSSSPGDARGYTHGDRGLSSVRGHDDQGGASRFFYCAKVSRAERNAGLAGFEKGIAHDFVAGGTNKGAISAPRANIHPTVKPIALMRWLARLVTPPGGTVLDPFLGSGTTGCAAALEGFDFIGCEREADYMPIAQARIAFWTEHGEEGLALVRAEEAADAKRAEIAEAGQLDLLSVLAELGTEDAA